MAARSGSARSGNGSDRPCAKRRTPSGALTIHTDNTDVAPFPFLQLARELRQISPAVRSPGVAEEYQELPLAAGRNVAELFGIRSQRQGESRRGVSEPERFRALGTRHGRTFVGFWTSDANLSIAMRGPAAGGTQATMSRRRKMTSEMADVTSAVAPRTRVVAPDEVSGPQLVHRVPVAKDADLLSHSRPDAMSATSSITNMTTMTPAARP